MCLRKQMIRRIEVNLNFGNNPIVFIYPTTLFQTVFENNEKGGKKRDFLFLIEIVKSYGQSFREYQNRFHPDQQLSSYSLNYHSRNSYDSKKSVKF